MDHTVVIYLKVDLIYLAIPYITMETANPANIINNQTFRDRGSKKANKLTDFSGAFTKRMLMPRSRKGIEKSTTYVVTFKFYKNIECVKLSVSD